MFFFFFQAEDGIRDYKVTGVQTCALPISRQVSTIYTPNNQYWVILELLPQYQRDPGALSLLNIRSQRGALVPLTAVATASPDVGPLSVNHSGQLPSVTLSFNLPPKVSLGDAVR